MKPTGRVLTAVLATTIVATGAAGVTVAARTHDAPGRTASSSGLGTNAGRFLHLTGDPAATAPAKGTTTARGAASAAGGQRSDCADDPATVGVMPNGWCIRPAGRNVDVLRFPLGLTATAEGKLVVSSDSGGVQGVTTVDPATMRATPTTAANLFMGIAQARNKVVYASGGNADRVFRFRVAGAATVSQDPTEAGTFPVHGALQAAGVPGDGIPVPGYPGPMTTYGDLLLVSGTLSEPSAGQCPSGQPACGRVAVIDTRTDTVLARVPVGMDAMGLAVDATHKRLYVANWADEAGRGVMRGGTVSVVDLTDPDPTHWHEVGYAVVGHAPTAVQLSRDGRRLFVANTNDDTLSVLDVTRASPVVVATESVRPADALPVGAHPDALALSPDGETLFVALAGLNAVEVRNGRTGDRLGGSPVYIPTGWYPSALTVTGDARHYRLWVTNAKGTGPGSGYNGSVLSNGTGRNGSLGAVDLPASPEQERTWTRQTLQNDALDDTAVDPCHPGGGVRVSQVLCPPAGRQSPIKHVVYLVTENKTFDQYFGDIGGGYHADPTYLLYGRSNTPNHHAIADQFALGDNFFSDAEVSVTGHSWTSGAAATDHNERTWEADYDQGIRGTHGNGDPLRGGAGGAGGAAIQSGEDELNDPEGGYIFEAFRRAGALPPSEAGPGRLSMAIYGEHTARESGHALDRYQVSQSARLSSDEDVWHTGDLHYFDYCRARLFIDGVTEPGALPPFSAGSPPAGTSTRGCEGKPLPDPSFSLAHWTQEYRHTGKDVMPSFLYLTLPVNHTLGTNVGSPTPMSMVADNDYAVGLIVDALSHSPFWNSTLVVQTEDDTQAAGDHVSALRDYLLVASPWAQPGPVHQWGSMPALLRTIEQLFGVAPVSLFDRLATPMHEAFVPSLAQGPRTTTYRAQRPAVPFALNQPGAVGAALSASMDWSEIDRIDEQLLNAILYAAIRHWPLRTGR